MFNLFTIIVFMNDTQLMLLFTVGRCLLILLLPHFFWGRYAQVLLDMLECGCQFVLMCGSPVLLDDLREKLCRFFF